MKTKGDNATEKPVFIGYTDASPKIEKAMERAVLVKNFLPPPEKLIRKNVTEIERKQTSKAWKRYLIKDHERGHRTPLSSILKEPTRRLDTSIILPESVYNWVQRKPNKAAFIRDTVMRLYKKTV